MAEPASPHAHPFTFDELYSLLLLLLAFWMAGKLSAKLRLPSLVGEIGLGLIAGPNALNIAPKPDSLMMFGEVGLLLLFLEAGIDVDLEMLKLVGYRGFALSLFASFMALFLGIVISHFGLGLDMVESFGVGATLAPTSMGVALNVLRASSVLNTPSGQLIIAAAMLQDVIGIILLAELKATKDPTALNFLIPVVSAVLFLLLFGYAAVSVIPPILSKKILPNFHHHESRQNVVLALILFFAIVLIPACHFSRGSYLLGCFLAGLCFCTDHHTHEVWTSQIKRLLQWLMRLFFACTIGFEVPVKNLADPKVVGTSLVFVVIIFAKLSSGIFAFPLSKREALKIGFSMTSSCELAFIISVNAWIEGLISSDTFDALILASLISILISPICLRLVLVDERNEKELEIARARSETMYVGEGVEPELFSESSEVFAGPTGPKHHLYFQLQTKSHGMFGHQDKLLAAIGKLKMSVIDYRSFHPHGDFNVHVVNEVYLKDNDTLVYDHSSKSEADTATCKRRMGELYKAATNALNEESAAIKVFRWLPGAGKGRSVNALSPVKEGKSPGISAAASQRNSFERPRGGSLEWEGGAGASASRGATLRRAGSGGERAPGMGGVHFRPGVLEGSQSHPEDEGLERRPSAVFDHDALVMQMERIAEIQAEKDYKRKHRHHLNLSVALTSHAHPGELLHRERHHELDGYVHTDAHDAFDPSEIDGEHFDSDSESSDDSDDDGSIVGDHRHGATSGNHTPTTIETGSRRGSFGGDGLDDAEGIELMETLELLEKVRHDTEHRHRSSFQQGAVIGLEDVGLVTPGQSQPPSIDPANTDDILEIMEAAKQEAILEALEGVLEEEEEEDEKEEDEGGALEEGLRGRGRRKDPHPSIEKSSENRV